MRVDEALIRRGLAGSLREARLLVMEGKVYQGGGKAEKASDRLREDLVLSVRDDRARYVSRGGLKLEKALKVFSVDPAGRVCLDVGASTGGFTDVLLQNGAARVYALDVGFGLLDWRLRSDERVVVMEKTNARNLRPGLFDPRPSLGVTDVSFISLAASLPPSLSALSGEGAEFVALVKPQFEARREQVERGGVVRDPAVHKEVLKRMLRLADGLGWTICGLDYSPITGAEGNIEFLIHLRRDAGAVRIAAERIDEVAEAARAALTRA